MENAFFDLNTPTESLPLPFRQQFTQALQAQGRQASSIRSFGANSVVALGAAQTLLADPSFQRMLQQVNAQAGNTALANRLTGLTAALDILNRPANVIRASAEGLTPDSALTSPPLEQVRSPTDLNDRLASLDRSIIEFGQLRDLARSLGAANPALRNAAGLGPQLPGGGANAAANQLKRRPAHDGW